MSEITGLRFLDLNQKTFQFRKSSTKLSSLHTQVFFVYREFAKFNSLMIHKYFMHLVSVRDNQNVNVKSLIMVTTCNKRLFHRQIFKFRIYKRFYNYPTLFQLLEPKTEN